MLKPLLIITAVALVFGCSGDSKSQDEGDQADISQAAADSSLVFLKQSYQHASDDDYAQALVYADKAIALNPKAYNPRDFKYDILRQLGRPQEALEVAIFNERLNRKNSPWDALKQAEAYMELHQFEQALDKIAEAVEKRGFRKYKLLQSPLYAPLQENSRFKDLVAQSVKNRGIDLPAEDFDLILLDGTKIRLSEMKGKIVLVDFWATWCSPCIREMPILKKLYAEHQGESFELIGISVDENLEMMREYVEREGLNWAIGYSGTGPGWEDEIMKRYKVNALPSTWIIDQQGIVRYQGLRGEELSEAVATLLNG
jgi:thiol-disulfide isomerase/thioredoxin